jgi:hypothetical protein
LLIRLFLAHLILRRIFLQRIFRKDPVYWKISGRSKCRNKAEGEKSIAELATRFLVFTGRDVLSTAPALKYFFRS